MTRTKFDYNTNLAKGTGSINETLSLIEFYQDGESKQSFLIRCISSNILDKSTEHRTKDVVNLVFLDRYWRGSRNVIQQLKELRQNGVSLDALKSLMYIYTARANRVFYDFVSELNLSGKSDKIVNSMANSFLLRAMSDNKAPSWSDSMIRRVSSYLMSCLKDFDLLDSDGYLNIKFPDQKVINYIVHELHFEGKLDNEIVQDSVWKLLGLTEYQILQEMEKISFRGTYIFQYSGEILKIGWNYNNMKEFIAHEFR